MSLYFLTGGSGVVGSALVPALLARTQAEIMLLLRPGQDGLAARRDALLAFWTRHYLLCDSAALAARVRVCAGDITAPGLGLAEDVQQELRARCTHIIHCAAQVRMNLALEQARRSAVEPVAAVLALARELPRLQKTEFLSTVGVGGRRATPLPESFLDAPPAAFHNTYEAAKFEAEELVRAAISRGLRATVHRPSMVIGDSHHGAVVHFQIFYFLCEFLSGRRTAGFYPNLGDATLDTISNDHLARAIVEASRDESTVGAVFNHCAGPQQALRLRALRTLVRQRFARAGRLPRMLPCRELPVAAFMALMKAGAWLMPRDARRGLSTLPVYLDYLASRQVFENTRTGHWLREKGIATPDVAADVAAALDFYLATTGARR
jgi:thioester reductase-like protein